MMPEPLAGVFPDPAFDGGVNARCNSGDVFGCISLAAAGLMPVSSGVTMMR